MKPSISYLVTTHNEPVLAFLLLNLRARVKPEDEVVILDDYSTNPDTTKVLNLFGEADETLRLKSDRKFNPFCGFKCSKKVIQHALDNDYGAHKNFGNLQCSKEYIWQLDGDECLPKNHYDIVHLILPENPDVELIFVPRCNIFKGVTDEHARQWNWTLTDSGFETPFVNFPDYQGRIYKNIPERIKWVGRLHERIEGHTSYAALPTHPDFGLFHNKTIEKQVETNLRYNRDFTQAENQGHNVFSSVN